MRKLALLAAGCLVPITFVSAPPSGVMAADAPTAILVGDIADGSVVGDYTVSADGSTIVYTVNTGSSESLYAVKMEGGAPVRLDNSSLDSQQIGAFEVSPDGARVIYVGDDLTDDRVELFVVSTDTGFPQRLSLTPGHAEADVRYFSVAPDWTTVAYTMDAIEDGSNVLFVVLTAGGGASLALVGPDSAFKSVDSVMHTPDGQRLIFMADLDTPAMNELYSTPALGGPVVKLNDEPAVNGDVSHYLISPDSSRVVFTLDRDVNEEHELFSVPASGGATTRLSHALDPGEFVHQFDFAISPASTSVGYLSQLDGQTSLYVAPIDDEGAAVAALTPTQPDHDVWEFRFSPSGARLLARILDGASVGTALVDLSASGAEVARYDAPAGVRVSPEKNRRSQGWHTGDGERYAFSTITEGFPNDHATLLTSGTGGAGAAVANDPLLSPSQFAITPGGETLVYSAQQNLALQPTALGIRSLVGEDAAVVALPESMFVGNLVMSANGRTVVFSGETASSEDVYALDVPVPYTSPHPGPGGGDSIGSALTVVEPVRVYDSRPDQPPAIGPKGIVAANTSVDVKVTGAASGVPDDAVAVVLNVTGTEAVNPGFMTVWQTGESRPLASSLNLTAPGQTRANAVIAPVSDDGLVSIYSQQGAHVVVDVTGYFTATDSAAAAGRMLPLAPSRILETRADQPGPGPKGLVLADSSIDVQIAGVGGVPVDASAAVLNITATDTTAATFVTTYGAGEPRPLASTLNINAAGETAPNLAIVPIGVDGKITLYSQTATHLVADVTGYVTGAGAAVDESGLFVAMDPSRLFDTRGDQPPTTGPKGFVEAGSSITVQVAGSISIPDQIGMVFANLTATEANTGYVTAHPNGGLTPLVSNLNLNGPNDTRPNSIAVPITNGKLSVFSQSGAHLLADINGYTLR